MNYEPIKTKPNKANFLDIGGGIKTKPPTKKPFQPRRLFASARAGRVQATVIRKDARGGNSLQKISEFFEKFSGNAYKLL